MDLILIGYPVVYTAAVVQLLTKKGRKGDGSEDGKEEQENSGESLFFDQQNRKDTRLLLTESSIDRGNTVCDGKWRCGSYHPHSICVLLQSV